MLTAVDTEIKDSLCPHGAVRWGGDWPPLAIYLQQLPGESACLFLYCITLLVSLLAVMSFLHTKISHQIKTPLLLRHRQLSSYCPQNTLAPISKLLRISFFSLPSFYIWNALLLSYLNSFTQDLALPRDCLRLHWPTLLSLSSIC